ncbi:MAG: XRE family transcriptional regulator [Cytophagales bacterium]|nr:XRE family transcriptional regulator [Cytophagales bacterium]MDW8384714.1 XRE family transcriptional regulator [Flammeovirgaceae bacterium]
MVNEENIRLIFGLKVKMLRQSLHMSLSELAEKTGISVSYLNEIEKGKKYPKSDKIGVLAQALNTTYEWLISLKLTKNLTPLANFLRSNILSELPLEVFGVSPRSILELFSDTPSKLNAFVTTAFDLARNHNITLQDFYFLALRSYQEMHNNYFEEIEKSVLDFREKYLGNRPITLEQLYVYAKREIGFEIDETSFADFPQLQSYRSFAKIEKKHKRLYLNHLLNNRQKSFILAREAGYHFMGIVERSMSYPWLKTESFDELLNNYKATYFAGALMIPETDLSADLRNIFQNETWEPHLVLRLLDKYNASPEMLMQRIATVCANRLGIQRLFYSRITHEVGSPKFILNKEMHLGGLHTPHSTVLEEHYCRRWLGINIIQELEKQIARGIYQKPIIGIQVSYYMDSTNQYLVISLARPLYPTPNINCSISIGFLIDEEFKQKCKFLNAPNVPERFVNGTCERCSSVDCEERAAPPIRLMMTKKQEAIQEAFYKLARRY